MDAAKAAVNKIISKGGQHDTEVDEYVRPSVTSETIKPHRHEEATQAIDREVHQDHYHTTVQPIEHKEVLPEKHTHQHAPVQEREFSHGDSDRIRAGVEREAAQFSNTSTTHETTTSQAQAPTVAGEHVHHHVHEVVQPIIHKETVQPEVVHTTIPIHETHHAQSEHHGISTLPTKTLDEFKKVGGSLTGGSHRHEEYDGHPRPYNPELQASRSGADRDPASHDGLHGTHTTGPTLTGAAGSHTGTTGGLTGHHHGHHTGHHIGTTGGLTGSNTGTAGDLTDSRTGTTGGLTGSNTGTAGDLTGSRTGTTGDLADSRTGNTSGLAETAGTTGTTGGLAGHHHGHHHGSNVSSIEHGSTTGTGLSSAGAGATGTALGGRAEGNTAGRALDAATSHGSSGVGQTRTDTGSYGSGATGTSAVGSEGVTGRGLEHATTDRGSIGVSGTHHHRDHADTSTSTSNEPTSATRDTVSDDVQSPRQGKDPNLVENAKSSGSGLKGEGVPGSHSAVFGLTPDGQKHDDTAHGSTSLRPAHSKASDTIAATARESVGDVGSRAPTGGAVADQMHDPRVAEKGHGGAAVSDTGSSKPGAGHPGGEQGFGTVRPGEHGGSTTAQNKLDPRTDADGDGKRGVLD